MIQFKLSGNTNIFIAESTISNTNKKIFVHMYFKYMLYYSKLDYKLIF